MGTAPRHLIRATLLVLALAPVSSAVFPPPAGGAPKIRSLGGGAWSWFADPRALHHKGLHNRTYVGWIDREGHIKVSSYDRGTELRTTVLLHRRLGVDDHNNPALHVLPGGRLMVFYSRHGGDKMYYRLSRRPEDVTSWSDEKQLPTNTVSADGKSHYTYPNPVQLSEEGNRLWLFWRGGSSSPTFSTSADDGRTWEPARDLIAHPGHRPYVKFSSNARNRIHFAFTQGHPRGSTRTSTTPATTRTEESTGPTERESSRRRTCRSRRARPTRSTTPIRGRGCTMSPTTPRGSR